MAETLDAFHVVEESAEGVVAEVVESLTLIPGPMEGEEVVESNLTSSFQD